nr:NrsF family protein [Paenacidovorax monticola]
MDPGGRVAGRSSAARAAAAAAGQYLANLPVQHRAAVAARAGGAVLGIARHGAHAPGLGRRGRGPACGGAGRAGVRAALPEMAAPFVALWYLAGMALPTALGALLGPRWLRW